MQHNPHLKERVILGIDPGFDRIGIAILTDSTQKPELIHSECFITDRVLSHGERLNQISAKISDVLEKYEPTRAGIETLLFAKNQKTALKVSEARGVIIDRISAEGIQIVEINPNTVKLTVTGYGKADKKQVIFMLERIFQIKQAKKYDDEYDAIAIAFSALSHPIGDVERESSKCTHFELRAEEPTRGVLPLFTNK